MTEGHVVGIRWFSQMNEWMDCLVLVNADMKGRAIDAVRSGIDEFWSGTCDCYGDCIEWALADACIPYIIEYEDPENYEDDAAWEKHLDTYISIGIPIFLV